MITINDKKELTKYIKLKCIENTSKKGWVIEFDDDLTINCPVEFDGKNKYDKILIAKNITFKDEVYIPWILASGNVTSEKDLCCDHIKAKNITAPNIYCDYIYCERIKAEFVSSSGKVFVSEEVECDTMMSNKFASLGKIRVKEFSCNKGVTFTNLTADNTMKNN